MKDANCVVIGGAGFIGSHMVDHLINEGNRVLVLDNLIVGRKDFVNPKAKFMWCDITHSETQLVKIFRDFNTDYVFNYAAEPYVPQSYERPLHVFDINARGALMVMNAASEALVDSILQVSSAEIYGSCPQGTANNIDESFPTEPHSTYGAAKLAIDSMVQTRYKESHCPVIALRQFNCLGERDVLHPYVLPEIYRQVMKDEGVVRLGNDTFRDFMYAGDAVRIAADLIENGSFGQVYNLGAEEGIGMYDLARLVGRILGKPVDVIPEEQRRRKWEIWHLLSDNTKIYKVVSARPELSLEDAVKATINYYLGNEDKWAF